MLGRRLQDSLREEFQRPVGRYLPDEELKHYNDKQIITVGDVVSLTVRGYGLVPLLSIYDGFTERHEHTGFSDLVRDGGFPETVVANPAGTITPELGDAVRNALDGTPGRIIRVEGEEDLALLPCVLFAPDGAEVIYGWPGKGMMTVVTDESSRRWAAETMAQMEELS